jgi:anthranilate synthase/aminodeoxychorismate synthase-like glutamine amidotransferase
MKILLLDNYDSFTFMLKDYIEQCGVLCLVMRNDDKHLQAEIAEHDALIISPGPETPKQAGSLLPMLNEFVSHKPTLGVCLGHQAIGMHYGAKLGKAFKPMHGKVDTLFHNGNKLFAGLPHSFHATRYHSLILSDLPIELQTIAYTADGEIMGIAHKSLPLWGIQFHPESCTTPFGLTIIKNFLSLAQHSPK